MPISSFEGLSVSVVIPFFNGHRCIYDALESIRLQEFAPNEILIVDDGSEKPLKIQKKILANLPPVKIISVSNGGQSKARNIGAAEAKSDWIAFLDQDDYWKTNHLSSLVSNIKRSVVAVYANYDILSLGNQLMPIAMPKPKTGTVNDALRRDLNILPSALIVNRTAFLGIGGFDESLRGYEDDDLMVRLLSSEYELSYLNRSTVIWRHSPTSSSRSTDMVSSRLKFVAKHFHEANSKTKKALIGRLIAPQVLAWLKGDKSALNTARAWLGQDEFQAYFKTGNRNKDVTFGVLEIIFWYVLKRISAEIRSITELPTRAAAKTKHLASIFRSLVLDSLSVHLKTIRILKTIIFGKKFEPISIENEPDCWVLTQEHLEPEPSAVSFYGINSLYLNRESFQQSHLKTKTILAKIQNSIAVGRSDLVFSGTRVYFDRASNPREYMSIAEDLGHLRYLPRKSAVSANFKPLRPTIPSAISLLSEGNGNFAHFVVETLAKIAVLNTANIDKNIPILLDGWISSRLKILIPIVNRQGRQVIYIDEFEAVQVNQLYKFVGPNLAAHRSRNPNLPLSRSYEFAQSAMKSLRNGLRVKSKPTKFVYLRRGSEFRDKFLYNSSRHVINEQKLISLLKSYGFQIIDPIQLSQIQIRELVSGTAHLISPIGAALVNSVFMAPGTRVTALAPWYQGASYSYYAQLMSSLELKFDVITGTATQNHEFADEHLPYEVQEATLKKYLEDIGYKPK